jgi:hypothetical protein
MPYDALSALESLTSNARNPQSSVQGYLQRRQRLDEMKRNLALTGMQRNAGGQVTSGFATGAVPEDIAQLEEQIAEDPDTGDTETARIGAIQAQNAKDIRYSSPEATGQRKDALAEALAKAEGPARVAAGGQLAVKQEENRGNLELQNNQLENTKRLLQTLTGPQGGSGQSGAAGIAGPGGSIKPTVNASGGVSFTTTAMPALVQRARNQLMDARDKTVNALHAAERQYPGINDEAEKVDNTPAGEGSALGRLFGGITGIGAPKYAGPKDRFNAGVERANYTLGVPTPFSGLAQEASFGNIEQMAGQLPGVRGLATITPMFKEHQSRWGHEAPLATAQRLRHMVRLMNETLHTLDTSGQGSDDGSDILGAAQAAGVR